MNRKEYKRQYYLQHREALLAYQKNYNELNKEKIREYFREYQKAHRKELSDAERLKYQLSEGEI